MKKIAIVGAGGFGREIKMLINQINYNKPLFDLIGFYDDNMKAESNIDGYPILGKINDLNSIDFDLNIAIAIGDPQIKKEIVNKINNEKIYFPNLIHPKACFGDVEFNSLGKGCIITNGVIMTTNIKIGNFVTINLGCTIGHDVIIGNYSSFMPFVNISGEVQMKELVYVGTSATIINQIKIGQKSTIGAGAVIIRDVPDGATVVGNPGKVIKIKEV